MHIRYLITIAAIAALSYCFSGCAEFMEDYSYSPVAQFSSASY